MGYSWFDWVYVFLSLAAVGVVLGVVIILEKLK